MVLKFEVQKVVMSSFFKNIGLVVLLSKGQMPKNVQKKPDPRKGHYIHYNAYGYVKENCFKLIDYLDWWKGKIKSQSQSR